MDTWSLLLSHYGSQVALAEALGLTQPTISRRIAQKLPLAAEEAVQLEHATGGALKRETLRPDLWPKRNRSGK